MRNVTPEQVAMAEQHRRGELPDRIEGALGELAGAAKEGLMALSVGVGLGVLHELMAAEVDEVVGPKGKHDRDRSAKRHGHEQTSVCLGPSFCPYSPKFVEGEFCELRLDGVLRSSLRRAPKITHLSDALLVTRG